MLVRRPVFSHGSRNLYSRPFVMCWTLDSNTCTDAWSSIGRIDVVQRQRGIVSGTRWTSTSECTTRWCWTGRDVRSRRVRLLLIFATARTIIKRFAYAYYDVLNYLVGASDVPLCLPGPSWRHSHVSKVASGPTSRIVSSCFPYTVHVLQK